MARTTGSTSIAVGMYVPPTDVPYYGLRCKFEDRATAILGNRAFWRGVMAGPDYGTRPILGPRVSGAVSAGEIRASERVRVADSFDARPAKDRSVARPYSVRQFKRDVRQGRRDDGTCRSIIVSSRRIRERGTEAALAAADGQGRTWRDFTPAVKRGAGRGRLTAPVKPSLISTLPPSNGGNPDA